MSLTTLSISPDYGYVILTATASTLLNQWHATRVASFRKDAGIPYPHAYAPASECAAAKEDDSKGAGPAKAKYLFNCAQRAHANYLEHFPTMLLSLSIGGLRYPLLAAGLGAAWCVARVVYALGYTNPTEERGRGRRFGNVYYLAEAGLVGLAGLTGWSLLTSSS